MGPTFSVALVKTPAPAKPEPLLVAATLSRLRAETSPSSELKCQSWADCAYARCVRKNFAIDLDKEIYRARHGEGKWPSPEIEQGVTMQFAAISAGAAA